MFSKAPVKRFNDIVSSTPGPDAYDPKLAEGKKGLALVKSKRFEELREETPGPGQYQQLTESAAKRKIHLLTKPSLNVSSCSGCSEVFKTPRQYPPTPSTKAKRKNQILSSGSSLGSLSLGESMDEGRGNKCCQFLEKKVISLEAELQKRPPPSVAVVGTQDTEEVVTKLRNELAEQKSLLDTNLHEIKVAEQKREFAEEKLKSNQSEAENLEARLKSLKYELDLLAQDNKTLEETAVESKSELEKERQELQAKLDFLHFTQEQLKTSLAEKEDEVKLLNEESHKFKEGVASLHQQVEAEREKYSELMAVYAEENEDTLREFQNLKMEKSKLMAEKFRLAVETKLSVSDNAKLQDENIALLGKMNDLHQQVEDIEEKHKKAAEEISHLKSDLDVMGNDKQTLFEELERVSKNKEGIELDLASTLKEKETIERQLGVSEEENKEIHLKIQELLKDHEKLSHLYQNSRDDNEEAWDELQRLGGSLQRMSSQMEEKENMIAELKSEVEELEMKDSSLQGSLNASESYLGNLIVENNAINEAIINTHEEIKSLTDKCGDYEKEIEGLKSMKEDLNQTCVLLESLKLEAEQRACDLQQKLTEKNLLLDEMTIKLKEAEELFNLQAASHDQTLQEKSAQVEKLLDMNRDLSGEVTGNLETIKTLQNSEQMLTARIEGLKRDLELEHHDFTAELHNHWEAEEEILALNNQITEMEVVERERCNHIESLRGELKRARSEYETKTANLESEKDNVTNEKALLQQEVKEKDKLIVKIMHNCKENNQAIEKYKGELKRKLGDLKAKDELIADLREEMANYDKVKGDSKEMETLLAEEMDKNEELKKNILKLEENAEFYREKFTILEEQIAPFREQLDLYETEKATLMEQNKATETTLKKLAEQHGKLMGHANHKQKINYVVKLKQENLTLTQEKTALQTKVKLQAKTISQLKEKVEGKENNNSSVKYLKAIPTARNDDIRRHTVSISPLANRNRSVSPLPNKSRQNL